MLKLGLAFKNESPIAQDLLNNMYHNKTTPKVVASRKLCTNQVTGSIAGIFSSKITQKTFGEREISRNSTEDF